MPSAPTVQRKSILRAVIAVGTVLALGAIVGSAIAVLWLLILRLTAGDE